MDIKLDFSQVDTQTYAPLKEAENTEKSGGSRYSSGKPGGWWYGPLYGLREVAKVWEAGADKYAPLDWLAGQSFSTLMDCMSRHWLEVTLHGPWARDEDTGAYHLANLAWNALCMLTFMTLGRHDLDDVSCWRGVTAETKRHAEDEAEERGESVEEVLREWGYGHGAQGS